MRTYLLAPAGLMTNIILVRRKSDTIPETSSMCGCLRANLDNIKVNSPPTVAKEFFPPIINAGGTSILSITFSNPNPLPANLTADFTDTLPDGVTTTGNGLSTTCGGTVVAVDGGNTIKLETPAVIPADGSCTITAEVTASIPGDYLDNIPPDTLHTDLGNNTDNASATLFVIAPCSSTCPCGP